MTTVKVKPWGEGQGEFVELNVEDFDPDFHQRLDGDDQPLPGPFDSWGRLALIEAMKAEVFAQIEAATDDDLRAGLTFAYGRQKAAEREAAAASRAQTEFDPFDHDHAGHKGGSADSTETGLAGMTVPQLRALAANLNTDLGPFTKKSDIIELIESVQAERAAEAERLDAPQEAAGGLSIRELHASLEGLGVGIDPAADVATKFAQLNDAREAAASA